MTLADSQRQIALQMMREYLATPARADGRTPVESGQSLDDERARVIDAQLKPLLDRYLSGAISLAEFKSRNDGINKSRNYWGFRGIKGQMFFNLLVNAGEDESRCDRELKKALACPPNDEAASQQIRAFQGYVKDVAQRWVEAGNSKHASPSPNSIPFFLSYFW